MEQRLTYPASDMMMDCVGRLWFEVLFADEKLLVLMEKRRCRAK